MPKPSPDTFLYLQSLLSFASTSSLYNRVNSKLFDMSKTHEKKHEQVILSFPYIKVETSRRHISRKNETLILIDSTLMSRPTSKKKSCIR